MSGTPAEFTRALGDFIRDFDPRVEKIGDSHMLMLPDFEPIPWHPPGKKRLSLREKPNQVFYEESATAALAFFLARTGASTFLDGGAHKGYFATLALNYKPHAIDAYAFEINPHSTDYLERAIEAARARGRHGELLRAALSDVHAGERDIWISLTKMFESQPAAADYRDPWWTRLKMALRGRKNRDIPQRYRIEITSIDYFCEARGIVPDIIKIDVDGYEAKVIPGARKMLERHKPVLFLELHKKKFIERFGVTREQIVAPLFALGYHAVLLENHHDRSQAIVPVTAHSPQIGREDTDMFVFFHDKHMSGAKA